MSILPASDLYSTLRQLYQNPHYRHSSPKSSYDDRLASFAAWPHTSPTPEQMARAGFKHMPTNEHPDNVICRCGDYLCDWKAEHDPWIQRRIHHDRCSPLWLVLETADRKMPSTSDTGFFDPSLQYDFPELCLFQNVKIFCNRIRRLKFAETDILALLPRCLRGEALAWFRKSKHHDLAVCLGAMRARFWQAPPEAPPEAPPGAPPQAQQAPPEAPPEAPQAPDYHHCKLCNASFSSIARLIRHTQENTCNKPCCRHCETAFSSKNQLHRHLREDCRKQMHRQRGSSSRSSSRSSSSLSPQSSPRSSSSASSTYSPTCSPPPAYRAISPPPPTYLTVADLSVRFAKPPCLKVDDLFRMFGSRSATKSSIRPSTRITIASDDPLNRQFVSSYHDLAKPPIQSSSLGFDIEKGGAWVYIMGVGDSHKQSPNCAGAMCSSLQRCRPPSLNTDKRQAMPIWA